MAVADLLGGFVGEQKGAGWQIGAAYAFTPDIQVSAGWQSYDFDAGANLNPAGLAQTGVFGAPGSMYAGDLKADIVYTEVSFGF